MIYYVIQHYPTGKYITHYSVFQTISSHLWKSVNEICVLPLRTTNKSISSASTCSRDILTPVAFINITDANEFLQDWEEHNIPNICGIETISVDSVDGLKVI